MYENERRGFGIGAEHCVQHFHWDRELWTFDYFGMWMDSWIDYLLIPNATRHFCLIQYILIRVETGMQGNLLTSQK